MVEIVESIGVRTYPDVKGFKQKLEAELSKIHIKFTVDIELGKIDTAKAQRQLEVFRALVERQSFTVHGQVDVDTARATAAVKSLSRELKDSSNGPSGLTKSLSGLSAVGSLLAKGLGSVVGRLKTFTQGVGGAVAGATKLGAAAALTALKFGAMAAGAVQAMSVIHGLGSAVASLAPAVALLPGVAIAAIGAIAALKVGLSGFSDVMKNASDPEAFAAGLATLAPSAQKVAIALKDLKPEWENLQKVVQQRLFKGLADDIKETANVLLPELQKGLTKVAGGFNNLAKEALAFVRSPQTIADLGTVLFSTRGALDNLAQGFQPILRGLTDIGTVGARMLPELTAGFGDAAKAFERYIAGLRNSGELEQIIRNALDSFGKLLDIVGNVFSIVTQIFSAAGSGGNLLDALATATKYLKDFLHTAQGTEALRQVFSVVAEVAKGITPVMKELARVFVTVLAPAIERLGPQLGAAFGNLAGAVEPAAKIISSLLPIVGDLAQLFTSVLSSAAEALVPAIQGIVPPIREAIRFISDLFNGADGAAAFKSLFAGIGGVIKGVLPLLQEIARVVVQYVAPALGKLGPSLGLAFNALVPAIEPLGKALAAILPFVGQVAGALANVLGSAIIALAPVVEALVPPLTKLIEFLGKFLAGAIDAVAPVLVELAKVIANGLMAALKAIEPVLPVFLDVLTKVADLMAGVLKDNMPVFVQLADILGHALLDAMIALAPLLPQMVQAFVDTLNAVIPLLPELGKLVAEALPELIKLLPDLLPKLLKLSETWVGLVKDMTPFITLLVEKLLPILPDLIKNFQKLLDDLTPIIKGINDLFQGWIDLFIGISTGDFPRQFKGLSELFKGFFEIIGGIAKLGVDIMLLPFREFFDLLKGLFSSKPDEAKTEFDHKMDDMKALIKEKCKTFLIDAGKALIDGFVDGITAAFPAAVQGAKNLLEGLRRLWPFSPAKEGPFSGKGYTLYSGRAMSEDFAKGIQDNAFMAKKAAEDLMAAAQLPFTESLDVMPLNGALDGAVAHAMTIETGSASNGVADAVREGLSESTFEINQDGVFKVTAQGGLDFGRK